MNDDAYVERANVLLRELENDDSINPGGRGAAYSPSDPSGYYASLGVSPKATPQEIRRAFLSLSQRYHTDKHTSQSEDVQSLMSERFQQLQSAYTVLSDERQRAAYDAGGDTGIQRLALVPVGLHRREDILQYVLSLDREAQLLQTSKMVSAASQTTLTLSTAHFFPFAAAAAGEAEEEEEEGWDGDGDASEGKEGGGTAGAEIRPNATVQPLASHAADKGAAQGGKELSNSSPSSASSSPPAAGAHSKDAAAPAAPAHKKPTSAAAQPAEGDAATRANSSAVHEAGKSSSSSGNAGPAMQAQLSAKEVVIDGKRQIVLIPNAEVQQQLRRRMHGESHTADGGSGATASPSSREAGALAQAGSRSGQPGFRRLAPAQALMLAAIPKSMTFRSSFQHMLTPRLTATFRTDAVSRPRKSATSLTTSIEYQPDEVRTYASSLRFSVTGLKWCLLQRRELSPLWALKSKLTALTGAQLLQKLELTLIRKLSPTAELESALAMSLNEHGFFRSSVNDFTEDAQQGVSAYIGFHTMYLTAYTGGKVILGVDTKDPKNPPVHGRLQYTINCSPLAGQTTLGVEAWYCPSKVQHYGLSFTTVLPYSISPIAPPLFLVESTQFAVVNQISLLYARGPHRISVPIIVFISPKVSQGLAWMSVPLTVYRIATMLYKPYARAKAIRYYTQQRKLHIAETDVAREKARLEQLALESLVLMSRASEERKGGLVIINARYGVIDPQFAEVTPPVTPVVTRAPTPPLSASASATNHTNSTNATPQAFRRNRTAGGGSGGATRGWWPSQIMARVAERLVRGWVRRHTNAATKDGNDDYAAAHDAVRGDAIPLFIDVTIAVQNMVRDSALTLPAGTKSTLVGFCDPDPYTPEQKTLKIVYWFRKRKHTAIFADEDEVELPQREHLMT
jgi:curved DNA-binding protein CbpA